MPKILLMGVLLAQYQQRANDLISAGVNLSIALTGALDHISDIEVDRKCREVLTEWKSCVQRFRETHEKLNPPPTGEE